MLRRVVDVVAVPRARLLGLDVVRNDDVPAREGRPSTIHLADPVVAPPVLEGRGEERAEDLDVRPVDEGVRQDALVRRVQGPGDAEVRRELRVLERLHVLVPTVDQFDRPRDRSIGSIGSVDSV